MCQFSTRLGGTGWAPACMRRHWDKLYFARSISLFSIVFSDPLFADSRHKTSKHKYSKHKHSRHRLISHIFRRLKTPRVGQVITWNGERWIPRHYRYTKDLPAGDNPGDHIRHTWSRVWRNIWWIRRYIGNAEDRIQLRSPVRRQLSWTIRCNSRSKIDDLSSKVTGWRTGESPGTRFASFR